MGDPQFKNLCSNNVLGRLAWLSPFPKEYTAPQTINPGGVLNKWTNAGLIGHWLQSIRWWC